MAPKTSEQITNLMIDPTYMSAEKRLWVAVLLTFVFDVQKDYRLYRDSMNGKRGKYFNRLVTHKIVASQPHMELLCSFVGMDFDCFKEKIADIADGKVTVDVPQYNYW